MATKKKCKDCDKKEKDTFYRAFIVYQSSNELTPGQMNCWKNFIAALEKENVIPYVAFQVGVPPGCIPTPGNPCPK